MLFRRARLEVVVSHDAGDFFVVVKHLQTRLADIVAGPTTTRQFIGVLLVCLSALFVRGQEQRVVVVFV